MCEQQQHLQPVIFTSWQTESLNSLQKVKGDTNTHSIIIDYTHRLHTVPTHTQAQRGGADRVTVQQQQIGRSAIKSHWEREREGETAASDKQLQREEVKTRRGDEERRWRGRRRARSPEELRFNLKQNHVHYNTIIRHRLCKEQWKKLQPHDLRRCLIDKARKFPVQLLWQVPTSRRNVGRKKRE